ncbi:MAG TPA: NADH-quinone oxidoreductase subunit L [Nocardioides sp.]|uniref:NADH-quinone oxidoreductase subunit L n=1 Tax=uncultured Nocardioides sp. TaxID=198441 RepID=UPI000EB8CEFE|nr:NADH-quinone oxidoreductase subunit L [uncultured Nocardioides sp.]HCB07196.1 NADH-quinone oxidoreductase subunit L [Nocardioides sp.]HRD60869.1 NADH-quinone oxidoreductase subunit L [Nocardioides sp.]HRI96564.1 NADH-quinone oxidoreductase subunit L [Nocardioides sp.]HRK46315.1 NADH-quinone oxidoreductase subunit L [Nocardioides sp.]
MLALHEGGPIPVVDPTTADGVFALAWLVIALPAAGAVILLIGGAIAPKPFAAFGHLLGTILPIGSFAISLAMFISLLGRPDDDRQVAQHLYNWIDVGELRVGMDLLYDPLTALFLLLITGVGSLIHIYSIGYMEHDPRRVRFFGYLNLFVAAMLMLVMSENYLGLFLGWEGVGLASYLLIGFWQHKPSAAAAAKKAFVINRVGDMGLSLAIMLAFVTWGSTSFVVISANVDGASEKTLTAFGLLLLLGACGKSAQVPLQAWLLDAMEGPTPVSALIHAATMVTAGVYLIVRSNWIFDLAPDARTVVIIVATVTLLWGAAIGCAKDDIKKALAGSTMSQIGYMMLGAGLGPAGYAFAIFHLLNHGFFKANMFLGAGSVMHGMNDDVDMRHYGALRKAMPITFLTFSMGYLAIIGFPGFSGFWSKDKIIEVALTDNWLVGICAIVGAGITGFYMTRLMLMTFFGEKRWDKDVHPHESPAVMTFPLIVLAALSVLGGVMLINDWIVNFLAPVTGEAPHEEPPIPAFAVSVIVVLIVAVGVSIAIALFGRRPIPREAPQDVSFVTRATRADIYGDVINDELVVKPGKHLTSGLVTIDSVVVDGAFTGGAVAVGGIGALGRRAQNGYVRSYALSLLGGVLLVVLALLAVNLA